MGRCLNRSYGPKDHHDEPRQFSLEFDVGYRDSHGRVKFDQHAVDLRREIIGPWCIVDRSRTIERVRATGVGYFPDSPGSGRIIHGGGFAAEPLADEGELAPRMTGTCPVARDLYFINFD